MKDFRTKPARTPVQRRSVRPRAPSSRSGSTRSSSNSSSHGWEKIVTRLIQIGGGVGILILIVVGLALYLLPKFFTVEKDATILWVPPREAVATQPSTLIHISPSRHHLVVASVAPGVLLEQPASLQGQSVGQAYYALQDQGLSPDLQKSTLGLALSHSLDEVRVVPLVQPITTQPELSHFLWTALQDKTGPLTLSEKLRWYFFVNSLAKSQTQGLKVTQAADWSKFYQAVTLSSEVKTCAIAVLNASGLNGVATRTARILENNDLTVISVTDTTQLAGQTTLIHGGSNPACQAVEEIVRHLVPLDLTSQTNSALATEYRADMVFSIGEDLAQVLSTPVPSGE